jgi:transcriptional regulator GlxA family with amidase domain
LAKTTKTGHKYTRRGQKAHYHGKSDNRHVRGETLMATNTRPLICLLASAETSASVVYSLYDVLSTVGSAYEDMVTGVAGEELLEVKIIAKGIEPFRCMGNVLIEPHAGVDDIDSADAVVVCDMYTPIDTPPKNRYQAEIVWLKRMYARDALICSVCSGSAVLAETGLLDGFEVSGHWAYRHMFRQHYPNVTLIENSILNLSAEHKRLVTTGGVTSWQNLVIYLIERFCGLQQALYTAKVFLLAPHTDGQLPFSVMTQRTQYSDALIQDCQGWIASNYDCTNPVAQMTERSGLSSRTFARRFRAATGYQPIEYVQGLRIEAAKQLLETETTAIDEISNTVGYEDPTSFRRLFKRNTGITPAIYRKKFCSISARVIT